MTENMQKIIICPDSFKGTMKSSEVTEIIARAFSEEKPNAKLVKLPIADGGEGTIDCFSQGTEGKFINTTVSNSNYKTIEAKYYLTKSSAIIESAQAIGLYLTEDKNPSLTTSFGVGQLILDALKYTNKIILTLGGSSTNDGGCGIAAALGAKFYDKSKISFIPTGKTLINIDSIDILNVPKFEMECMCDISNTMYGQNGAAYVYAPQKGADAEMVENLDKGLKHLSTKIIECIGCDVSNIKGGGAAGAISAGMVAFCGATLNSGINIMLDMVNFDDKINDASLIITGEGKLDSQSFSGKVIDGILKRAKPKNVPVIAIVGSIEKGLDWQKQGLTYAIETSKPDVSFEKLKFTARDDLYNMAKKLAGSIIF